MNVRCQYCFWILLITVSFNTGLPYKLLANTKLNYQQHLRRSLETDDVKEKALAKASARKSRAQTRPMHGPLRSHFRIDPAKITALLREPPSEQNLTTALTYRSKLSAPDSGLEIYIAICYWSLGKADEGVEASKIALASKENPLLRQHLFYQSLRKKDSREATIHLEKSGLAGFRYLIARSRLLLIKPYAYPVFVLFAVLIYFLTRYRRRIFIKCLTVSKQLMDISKSVWATIVTKTTDTNDLKNDSLATTILKNTTSQIISDNTNQAAVNNDLNSEKLLPEKVQTNSPISLPAESKASRNEEEDCELVDFFSRLQTLISINMQRIVGISYNCSEEEALNTARQLAIRFANNDYMTLLIDAGDSKTPLYKHFNSTAGLELTEQSLSKSVFNRLIQKSGLENLCLINRPLFWQDSEGSAQELWAELFECSKNKFDIVLVFFRATELLLNENDFAPSIAWAIINGNKTPESELTLLKKQLSQKGCKFSCICNL